MAGTNGTAASARRTYSAVPKTSIIPIEVERDGKAVVVDFIGFHRERPEVWVQIEVEAARDRFLAEVLVDNVDEKEVTDPESGETSVPEKLYQRNDVADAIYRREVLVAVLKEKASGQPLSEADADVLIAAGGGWQDILAELGWWDAPADEGAASGPEAGGEGAEPTGSASSPSSSASTTASPTTA